MSIVLSVCSGVQRGASVIVPSNEQVFIGGSTSCDLVLDLPEAHCFSVINRTSHLEFRSHNRRMCCRLRGRIIQRTILSHRQDVEVEGITLRATFTSQRKSAADWGRLTPIRKKKQRPEESSSSGSFRWKYAHAAAPQPVDFDFDPAASIVCVGGSIRQRMEALHPVLNPGT